MFGALHTENIMNLYAPVWSVPEALSYQEQRLLTDLAWRTTISDGWTAEVSVTHNLLVGRLFAPVDSSRDDIVRAKASDLQAEASSTIEVNTKTRLVIGVLSAIQTGRGEQPGYTVNGDTAIHAPIVPFPIYQRKNPAPLQAIPAYTETWSAFYAQVNTRVLEGLSLVGGMQLHKLSELPVTAVLRGGAVYANPDGWTGKILYAQAFRPASAQERKAEVPGVLYGNEYVKPERMETIEGQIAYLSRSFAGSATLFNNAQRDLITMTRPGEVIPNTVNEHATPPGVPFFINRGSLASRGIELEMIWNPSRRTAVFASYTDILGSYSVPTVSGTDSSVTNYFGMPRSIVKIGAHIHANSWLAVAASDSWYARFTELPDAPHLNPLLAAFHNVTLTIRIALPESFLGMAATKTSLSLQVANLLDTSINLPEYSTRLVNSVPGLDRRTVSVGCMVEL
jgi:outer membrane receptor protein involved in Fe transport